MTITRITGYTQKGVPPTADRALYAALAGPGSYVLPYGAKIAASLKDAQHLAVQDGAILHNGTLSTLDGSTEFVIPPGAQGSKRSNIAVARHLNDGTTESTIPFVLSGELTSDGEPTDPTWETGNLLDGATVSDMPLYRVVTDGISASEPEPLFDTLVSISSVRDSQSQEPLLIASTSSTSWQTFTIEVDLAEYRFLLITMEIGNTLLGSALLPIKEAVAHTDASGTAQFLTQDTYGTAFCAYSYFGETGITVRVNGARQKGCFYLMR